MSTIVVFSLLEGRGQECSVGGPELRAIVWRGVDVSGGSAAMTREASGRSEEGRKSAGVFMKPLVMSDGVHHDERGCARGKRVPAGAG